MSEYEIQAGLRRRRIAPVVVALAAAGIAIAFTFLIVAISPGQAHATGNSGASSLGNGSGSGSNSKKVTKARIKKNGKATVPRNAPKRVKRAIRAANRIVGKPYGAPTWRRNGKSPRYDCSAAISYVIGKKGAKLLKNPTWSGPLMRWGKKGKGKWITVYSNKSHAYVMIAGLRFESRGSGNGPRWRTGKATKRDWSGRKYAIRHKGKF